MSTPAERKAPKLHYRPDVDGLRAVAVLLVIADHLRTRFSGGYIGVDVFFVISGYLISSVILTQMAEGRFSIVDFYERRIRRIFPALLVMLAFTTVLVYRYFVPSEVVAYGRSLVAALFSASNFLFWSEAGYFDGPSALKPLLHTWSLAVEEQFYILFPILLLLVRRYFPARMKAAILTIAGLSFAAAVVTVFRYPIAAFFFAPLRAWELLIGTVVSQRYLPVPRTALTRNLATAAGILLIFVPSLMLQQQSVFPGLSALPPCLGAALIIAGGETGGSLVGAVLSWRPVVFIGLISYSLYLWHWPILVFQNTSSLLVSGPAVNTRIKALVFAVSLVAGWLSWLLVEQPFRKGRFRPARRGVFLINGLAAAFIALAAFGLVLSHGAPARFPPAMRQVAEYTDYNEQTVWREGVCFIGPHSTNTVLQPECLAPNHPGRRSILLIGDSHAAQLWPGFAAVYPDHDLLEATVSACRPLEIQLTNGDPNCRRIMSSVFNDLLLHRHIDTVVLAGRWADYELGELTTTLAYLRQHGLEAVVIGPNIEYDEPLPRVLAIAARENRAPEVEEHRDRSPQVFDQQMATLARERWHVPYISIYSDLCGTGACPLYAAPGVPLLFDTDHLTAAGSELLVSTIRARGQIQ